MAGSLPSISPFVKGTDFNRWLKGLDFYVTAMDIADDRRKTAVLMHLMGAEIQDIYETLPDPQLTGTPTQFEICVAKLRQYLQPTTNVMAERVTFQRTNMTAGETFDEYLARLRAGAGRCGFTAADLERELRDRSVAGATPQIQERLLQTVGTKGDSFTLRDLQATARAYEETQRLVTQFRCASLESRQAGAAGSQPHPPPVSEVDAVGAWPASSRTFESRGRHAARCFHCGKAGHLRRDCPERQGRQQLSAGRGRPAPPQQQQRRPRGRERDGGTADGGGADDRRPETRRCFRCKKVGHLRYCNVGEQKKVWNGVVIL